MKAVAEKSFCAGCFIILKFKEETIMAKIIGKSLPNMPWQDKPQG